MRVTTLGCVDNLSEEVSEVGTVAGTGIESSVGIGDGNKYIKQYSLSLG